MKIGHLLVFGFIMLILAYLSLRWSSNVALIFTEGFKDASLVAKTLQGN